MKSVIAFDLDGTLAPSKSRIPESMADQLRLLLEHKQVCVISGGKFEQFEKQLLAGLELSEKLLIKLHFMPTCGTRYLRYDLESKSWKQIYAENFTEDQKQKIIKALNKGFDDLAMREKKVWGECVEDRGSQITFSVLGQDIVDVLGDEGVRLKEEWDPNNEKKNKLRDYIAPLIPEFEVRVGGVTSIDVTKLGVDKAYGMKKLMAELRLGMDQILFIGDRLSEGGNDYPVKVMGIDSISVTGWQDTRLVCEVINKLDIV